MLGHCQRSNAARQLTHIPAAVTSWHSSSEGSGQMSEADGQIYRAGFEAGFAEAIRQMSSSLEAMVTPPEDMQKMFTPPEDEDEHTRAYGSQQTRLQ